MQLRRIIAFLLTVFCAVDTFAQSPGYMGKKTHLGAGIYLFPALGASRAGVSDSPINILSEFYLETVVAPRTTLGVSVKLYKTTHNNTETLVPDGVGYLSGYNYETFPEGSYTIRARNYSLYMKMFKARYLAPWGRYFMLGLTLNQYECSYDPEEMYTRETMTGKTIINRDFGPTVQSFQYPDCIIGSGSSRILKDRIILDYGFNVNVLATAVIVSDNANLFGPPSQSDYIRKTSGRRMRGMNRANVFFKLGYLF